MLDWGYPFESLSKNRCNCGFCLYVKRVPILGVAQGFYGGVWDN